MYTRIYLTPELIKIRRSAQEMKDATDINCRNDINTYGHSDDRGT
jgi:hypothetical protein